MKKIKNYLKYFLIFLLFGGVAYASSGLMSGSFSLSNQKIVIKPEAFYPNSINADAISSGSITNLKLASNIDASKITGTIPSSSIPSSLVGDSNNSQTLSGRTLEYTLTNDDTKIPTSKAILDKILPLYSCSTTKLYDYDLPDTDGLDQITVTKTVSITGGQYVLTGVFKCVDGSFEKVGDDVISDLYCNPGYWSNGSTDSCSEVGLGYYSTGGLNRSVCTNILTSNSSYSSTTSTTASCATSCNSGYILNYYGGGKCEYDCATASVGESCYSCNMKYSGVCMSFLKGRRISSNLIMLSQISGGYGTSTYGGNYCGYLNSTYSHYGYNVRFPTLDEIKTGFLSHWLAGDTTFAGSGVWYWTSSVYGPSSRYIVNNSYDFYKNFGGIYRETGQAESSTAYSVCVHEG